MKILTAYSDLQFITLSSLFWGLALLGGRVGPLALLLGGLVPLLRLHRSPVRLLLGGLLILLRGLLILLLLRGRVLLGLLIFCTEELIHYRVTHLLANLGWVDFDFGCSTQGGGTYDITTPTKVAVPFLQ